MGVKTGLNEAFVIDQTTRDRLIAEDPRSAEIIKPWLRGRDVKRWRVEWAGLYIIAIPKGSDEGVHHPWTTARSETEARSIFARTYPAIHRHLSQFEKQLRVRQDQGDYWWELRACAYYAELEKPKIVYPEFGILPQFGFDSDAMYIANKLFCIPDASPYLLGVLNSSVCHYFLMYVTSHIQSDYIEFRLIHVSQVPIPNALPALRTLIESAVHELLSLHGQGPRAVELEAELNRLVYQAYDLTPAEIALIEGQVKK
jgi:hypothetical protein